MKKTEAFVGPVRSSFPDEGRGSNKIRFNSSHEDTLKKGNARFCTIDLLRQNSLRIFSGEHLKAHDTKHNNFQQNNIYSIVTKSKM